MVAQPYVCYIAQGAPQVTTVNAQRVILTPGFTNKPRPARLLSGSRGPRPGSSPPFPLREVLGVLLSMGARCSPITLVVGQTFTAVHFASEGLSGIFGALWKIDKVLD